MKGRRPFFPPPSTGTESTYRKAAAPPVESEPPSAPRGMTVSRPEPPREEARQASSVPPPGRMWIDPHPEWSVLRYLAFAGCLAMITAGQIQTSARWMSFVGLGALCMGVFVSLWRKERG